MNKVSVIMLTYNHCHFIKQAIEGVLQQKINYEYELLVVDDCSPDSTSEIVSQIVASNSNGFRINYIRNKKNIGPKENFLHAVKQASGTYIAICEGDDYWTDDFKLQKQVDFLDANPKYSFCWHRFQKFNQVTGLFSSDSNGRYFQDNTSGVEFTYDVFYKGWEIGMQTMVFRRNNFDLETALKYRYFKDTHLITYLLKYGNGFCLNFYGAVYRIHGGGMNTSLSTLKAAKIGYKTYKELFSFNSNIDFIRLKFFWYSQNYIDVLIANNKRLLALNMILVNFYYNPIMWRLKENLKNLILDSK